MDNACVIGFGMVGKATAMAFGIDKHFDIDQEKSNITLEDASKCRYIFICIPTPNAVDGSYGLRPISEVIKQIQDYGSNPIFIIRSTVRAGYASFIAREFGANIVSNPEFLSEDTWEKEAQNPRLIVIGSDMAQFRDDVAAIYRMRYSRIKPILCDNTTAEAAKLLYNAESTIKTIKENENYNFCQLVKANYEIIKQVTQENPWGSKVPFEIVYKGRRGVAGRCLPKDIRALANQSGSAFYKTLEALHDTY